MSLSELKYEIVKNRIQQLEVTEEGVIVESDQAIFNFEKGTTLSDSHPFLEGLQLTLPAIDDQLFLPCVNLEVDEVAKIVDIQVIHKNNSFYLLLLDFTQHYQAAHPLVQEKNEASIAKNKLDFEKRLMQAKENFKNSFLSNLNHEIRNPLNTMLGFMDLLGESKLNYDQNETLKAIRKTGAHIKVLMDDMLDISKIEQGVITKKHVNFHLGAILSSLQSHFDLKYRDTPISFEITVEDLMLKTYKGDPNRLNQILFNLIENAFRNTDKGTINLNISSGDHDVNNSLITFEISDTGVGIPKQELAAVFNSYYQLKLAKEKPIGEGLGLKIVQDLVCLLEGKITVDSEEGKGSIFTCSIPFEKRKAKKEKKTVRKGTGVFQSKKLLILEDDASNQMLFMKLFLNNEKGYVLELASSGSDAKMFIEKKKYDLIILKKQLPDMSGIQFMNSLGEQREHLNKETPILMASGSTMLNEQQAFIEAGADSFLAKPYTKKELFNTIEKLIR